MPETSEKKAAYTLATQLLPKRLLLALTDLGFSRKYVLDSFAAYHLETNFFTHAEAFLSDPAQNRYRLTREDLYTIWTPNASRDIAEVLDYIETRHSKAVANLFLDEVLKGVEILCLFPDIGMNIAPGTDVRRIQVQKNYAVTYAKIETHIVLLNIFDLRGPGNPDNKKKKPYRSSKLF